MPRCPEPAARRVNAPSIAESARVGADAVRANPLRTLLATAGVAIGVAAVHDSRMPRPRLDAVVPVRSGRRGGPRRRPAKLRADKR